MAFCHYYLRYYNDYPNDSGHTRNDPTHQLVSEYYSRHPSVRPSIKSPAVDHFFHCLEREIFSDNNDPLRHLCDRLRKGRTAGMRGNKKDMLTTTEIAALTIKAWNMWVAGQPVKSLRWGITKGEAHERFPTPLANVGLLDPKAYED